MTLLYRRCLHFLYTIQNNHSLFYFSVSQKHPRFRLAILIYNLEMWRSYCNMKTAAWNYDDLWLGSAFSNGVFNTTQIPSVLNGWPADPDRSSMNGGFCGKIIYKRGDCHGLSIAMLDCRRVARKDRKASWLMVDAGWFLMGGSVWEVMLILITTSNKLKILKLRDQDTTGAGKLQTVCPGVFVWRFLCEARWTPSHPRSPSLFHTLSFSLYLSLINTSTIIHTFYIEYILDIYIYIYCMYVYIYTSI